MQSFIVSARKYRPLTFESVVGQEHITKTLKTALKNNQLAQSFLFCGPRGVGKTTCARILAKSINCLNPGPDCEPCNQCESCRSFNENHSFNIHELDAASNNSVENIRELIEMVRYAPQVGKFSIYIIDEAHMLSTSAFNAFLKTLEEPPPHAVFILATTERHKILPTILSRCQVFDFNRIQVADIAKHLAWVAKQEGVQYEDDGLYIIAQKADGALRDSLSIFDQLVNFTGGNLTYKAVVENLNVLDYDYYFKITDAVLQHNIPQALIIFDEVLRNGFDGHTFITGLGSHFRNLLVCLDEITLVLLEVSDSVKGRYREQSRQCTNRYLVSCLEITNKADADYRLSKHQRLTVEIALMQLCSLGAGGEQVSTVEKKN